MSSHEARNRVQIRTQAMTNIQCHFCNWMADVNLFLLTKTVSFLPRSLLLLPVITSMYNAVVEAVRNFLKVRRTTGRVLRKPSLPIYLCGRIWLIRRQGRVYEISGNSALKFLLFFIAINLLSRDLWWLLEKEKDGNVVEFWPPSFDAITGRGLTEAWKGCCCRCYHRLGLSYEEVSQQAQWVPERSRSRLLIFVMELTAHSSKR